MNDSLCAQSVTSSPRCQEATGCRCNQAAGRETTYLLDLLGFPQLHRGERLLVVGHKWAQFSPSPAGANLKVWHSGRELPILVIIQQLDARFQLCLQERVKRRNSLCCKRHVALLLFYYCCFSFVFIKYMPIMIIMISKYSGFTTGLLVILGAVSQEQWGMKRLQDHSSSMWASIQEFWTRIRPFGKTCGLQGPAGVFTSDTNRVLGSMMSTKCLRRPRKEPCKRDQVTAVRRRRLSPACFLMSLHSLRFKSNWFFFHGQAYACCNTVALKWIPLFTLWRDHSVLRTFLTMLICDCHH